MALARRILCDSPVVVPLQSLRAHALVRRYGDRTVLDGVDLLASPGTRFGLIGDNGTGKSTLLRLLAGVDTPDGGTVSRPADLAYLPQEPVFDADATVGSVLDDALAPLHDAVARLEQLAAQLDDPAARRRLRGDARLGPAARRLGRRPAGGAGRAPARARCRRPRPAGGRAVRRRAHPAVPGRAGHPTARVRPARRADQPPRRRRDDHGRGLPARPAGRGGGGQPRPGVPRPGVHRPDGPRPVRARHRRPRRAAFRRRVQRLHRTPCGCPAALGGDVRRPAGAAALAAAPGHDDGAAGGARARSAGQRQVHPPLQGRQRAAHGRPPGARHRAAHRGGRA